MRKDIPLTAAAPGRRIGILGGTFDPVHYGHLVAAQEAAWHVNLSRVLFVPAYHQPLKGGPPTVDAAHRVAMVRLAIGGNPLFELSTVELDRRGVSYTVDTLRDLYRADPAASYFFILGMDALAELPRWHKPAEMLRLAEIIGVHRAGWDAVDLHEIERTLPAAAGRVRIVPIPGLDISATDLRERVRAGRPIRYLVPAAVEAYIAANGLYRD